MLFNKKKPEVGQTPVIIEEPVAPQLPEIQEPEPVQIVEAFSPAAATMIGKGITFYGDFTGEDPIIVNGSVMGDISTTSSLTVSETGAYSGNAEIHDLEIDGNVKGDIQCENATVLGERSVMKGHLSTTFLETKKGSTFKGKLEMINAEDDDEQMFPAPAPEAAKKYEPVEFNWNTSATPEPAYQEPAYQAPMYQQPVYEEPAFQPAPETEAPAEDINADDFLNFGALPEDIKIPDLFSMPETGDEPK